MNNTENYDYKKYLQLIIKKKYLFVILALVIMTGVVITSYLLPERYEAKSTIFIEKSAISELVKGIAITPSFDDELKVLAYTLKSRPLILKVLNDLDSSANKQIDRPLENTVWEFQKNTDIKMKDNEGMFTITFNNESPRLAKDYVNALASRYIEENIATKRKESSGATTLLAEQIAATKGKLDEAEARANSYKRDKGSMLVQNESLVLAEIGQAQQKIEEVAIRRRQLENMRSLAKKNDPMKTKLAILQKKHQELGLVYTDNHPEVIETKNEIASVKQQIQSGYGKDELLDAPSLEVEKIAMELNTLRDTESNLHRFIASKQSLLRSIPAAMTGLEELEREKNSQKSLYEQLVTRYGQSEVSKQMDLQDKATTFRIVEAAMLPTQPYSPQRVKIILLGIVGGIAASFGILVLLDHLDSSVRNIDSLKSLGIPILAVVPTIDIPAELEALRKRDYWFYCIAGTCFVLILATIPLELMRTLSFDLFSYAGIKMNFKDLIISLK